MKRHVANVKKTDRYRLPAQILVYIMQILWFLLRRAPPFFSTIGLFLSGLALVVYFSLNGDDEVGLLKLAIVAYICFFSLSAFVLSAIFALIRWWFSDGV